MPKQNIVKVYDSGMVKLHERNSRYFKWKFSFPLRPTLPLQKEFPLSNEQVNAKSFWM